MIATPSNIKSLISSLVRYFELENNSEIVSILKNANPSIIELDYNYRNQISTEMLVLEIDLETYRKIHSSKEKCESTILEAVDIFQQPIVTEGIVSVCIKPIMKEQLNLQALRGVTDKREILDTIERIKEIMVAVSTNGVTIQTVDADYQILFRKTSEWLKRVNIDNPNAFESLWDWYRHWKQSDLKTYDQRRNFIKKLYESLVKNIEELDDEQDDEFQPTGWQRVDRTVNEMKHRLSTASTEEQYQAIGLLGREALISIAQEVFRKDIHLSEDSFDIGPTDTKRMLEAYINYMLQGSPNERHRKFAKSAVELANQVTHDRTATKRDAEMCLISLVAVANLIRVIDTYEQDHKEHINIDDIPF